MAPARISIIQNINSPAEIEGSGGGVQVFNACARAYTWGKKWESRGGGQNPSWPGPILCGERGAWKAVSRGRKGVRACTHNFTGTNLVIFNELTKKWGRKRKNGGGIVTKTKRLRQRKRKL